MTRDLHALESVLPHRLCSARVGNHEIGKTSVELGLLAQYSRFLLFLLDFLLSRFVCLEKGVDYAAWLKVYRLRVDTVDGLKLDLFELVC